MDSKVERFFASISGKRVTFCGMGISNTPLIHKMLERGALVTVRDRRTREQIGGLADEMEDAGARLILGAGYLDSIDADIVVRTPGISFTMPEFTAARRAGIVVTSEMEIFFDLCPANIIGITGSDGKTTTSTLIAKILEADGKNVYLGGNIGRPLLPLVDDMTENDYVVAELSSFQLLSMRKGPDIAVVTNVAPNHLDVHASMEEYINAKKNLFIHQNAFSKTVLNARNEITNGFTDEVRGQAVHFSRGEALASGAYLGCDGYIYMAEHDKTVKIMHKTDIMIPGDHNIDNYLAAVAAVWGLVSVDSIVRVAREFGGVEHRIEFIRELGGVRYYNDSIATSPTRTVAGLNAFSVPLVLIAGGYDKHIPFSDMAETVCRKVKLMILTGDTADKIEQTVRQCSQFDESFTSILRAQDMEEAVRLAAANAKEGDVVTLSPACASFDKYKNFEARGLHFKELVNAL